MSSSRTRPEQSQKKRGSTFYCLDIFKDLNSFFAFMELIPIKTEYRSFRIGNTAGMFSTDWTDDQRSDFVRKLDDLIAAENPIKSDSTSTVCKTTYDKRTIVIKRYNNKGFLHSIKNSIRPTRAQKSWQKSCLLIDFAIFTPTPLGYVVEKKAGLYHRSYFIMEYCPAPTYDNILLRETPSQAQQQQILNNIKIMLDKFAAHKITHGDLKQSNILVGQNSVGIIDLDAMKINDPFTYKAKRKKDEHFFNNRLQETPEQYAKRLKDNFNITSSK